MANDLDHGLGLPEGFFGRPVDREDPATLKGEVSALFVPRGVATGFAFVLDEAIDLSGETGGQEKVETTFMGIAVDYPDLQSKGHDACKQKVAARGGFRGGLGEWTRQRECPSSMSCTVQVAKFAQDLLRFAAGVELVRRGFHGEVIR